MYAITNNLIKYAITNDVIQYAITNDVIKYAVTNDGIIYAVTNDVIKYAIKCAKTYYVINKKIITLCFQIRPAQLTLDDTCLFVHRKGSGSCDCVLVHCRILVIWTIPLSLIE